MVRLDKNIEKQIDTLGKRVRCNVSHHSRCSFDIFLKTKFKISIQLFFENYRYVTRKYDKNTRHRVSISHGNFLLFIHIITPNVFYNIIISRLAAGINHLVHSKNIERPFWLIVGHSWYFRCKCRGFRNFRNSNDRRVRFYTRILFIPSNQ
jgi:hypothetical protein